MSTPVRWTCCLYLIRREEVDIYDIPISRITEQYIKHVELLHQIDPDAVGQFLVLAATLMEIKSRMLLPTPPEEVAEEDTIDPRSDLVRQLLEYKRFKDAAGDLQARAEEFGKRFPRSPVIPDKDSMDLEDAEVWDLMAAFNKLMQQTGRTGYQHQVVYDDTPIATHALNIVDQLQKQGGSVEFANIFAGKSRPQCVGHVPGPARTDPPPASPRGPGPPLRADLRVPARSPAAQRAGGGGVVRARRRAGRPRRHGRPAADRRR